MAVKTERINLRLSEGSLALLRRAAELQQQDLTSFMLGAALSQAREVVAAEQVIRLSPSDWASLQTLLQEEPRVIPELRRLFEDPEVRRVIADVEEPGLPLE